MTALDHESYLTRQIDDFITELKADVKNGDIDPTMAQAYAEHFRRSIATRVKGTISVTFEVELDLDPGVDKDELDGSDFNISLEEGWSVDGVSIDTCDVSDVEIDLEEL